jgi:hypothetical protein
VLFTIYTTPLGNIIRRHGLTFHLYADDTQLYFAFKPSSPSSKQDTINRIENCVEDIRIWMADNLLKLNDDKTEVIVITSRQSISERQAITINVGGCDISPSEEPPKNLGVLFDSTCGLKHHINKLCKSINYNVYCIGKIRKYLTKSSAEMLVNATVTSRLDYCNSLLYGVHECLISQLQRCQNNAARVVTLTRKYNHITPVLFDLHWLPVRYRITFKILLLTYKSLNGLSPAYLSDLLKPYKPCRALRSSDNHLLTAYGWRLENFGKRSFQVAAPCLWNDIPLQIRHSATLELFKSRLKTYLFTMAYSC